MIKYSIIKYVPDPIAGEFVNVGLILIDNGQTFKYIKDSRRAIHFATKELWETVYEFLTAMEVNEKVMKESKGVIQFTPLLPTILSFDTARDHLMKLFIKD